MSRTSVEDWCVCHCYFSIRLAWLYYEVSENCISSSTCPMASHNGAKDHSTRSDK
jgi:hypothetical protein